MFTSNGKSHLALNQHYNQRERASRLGASFYLYTLWLVAVGWKTPPSQLYQLCNFRWNFLSSTVWDSCAWEQSEEKETAIVSHLETTEVWRDKCEGCSEELLSKNSKFSLKEALVHFLYRFFGGFRNGHSPFCVILSVASHKRFSTWNHRGVKCQLGFSLICGRAVGTK